MKKLLVVLLSLGLIVAFGATASAADVKFGGSYYVVGLYENNPPLTPSDTAGYASYSHAFFYQRVRLQPVFAIAEGLTFTARMDAMEKQWGNTNWKGGADDTTSSRTTWGGSTPTASQKIQESFEFERGYVTFMTAIGQFQVGYQNVDDWGTDFSDYSNSRPRILYATKLGPVTLSATYEKLFEADTAVFSQTLVKAAAANLSGYLADGTKVYNTSPTIATTASGVADGDGDTYALSATFNAKGMEAGLLYKYYALHYGRTLGIKSDFSLVSPYVKATFGPVYIEGEAQYYFGKAAAYEAPYTYYAAGTQDVDLKAWGAYLKAKVNAGPAYFGALFAYASGDDLSDMTKNTTSPGGCGTNFAPALILMNDALNTWTNKGSAAALANQTPSTTVLGTTYNTNTSSKYNSVIYNAFAGFNPTPKLNVEAAVTYATVDKKALSRTAAGVVTEAISDKLGTEFDVKATYKIYDNLTYMVGAGYLWAGDWFKGANTAALVDNNYILLNQLTLSF